MTTVTNDGWSVEAIKFTTQTALRSTNFLRYEIYGEPDAHLHCDFSLWVIRTPTDLILVDTGFTQEAAASRNQFIEADVIEALEQAGYSPTDVSTIIYSHLHYDHVGNLEHFPAATVYVQREEYEFWRGPLAQRLQFAQLWEQQYAENLERVDAEDRLVLLDGDSDILPGVSALRLGGHTVGTQAVKVDTPSKTVVLASDAVHYIDELDKDMPFAVVANLPEMYLAFDRLKALAQAGARVIPGHDVSTRAKYPSHSLPCGAVVTDLLR